MYARNISHVNANLFQLILMYKRSEEDLIKDRTTNFHQMRIFASRFHSMYPNLIITGGWDDTVRVISL